MIRVATFKDCDRLIPLLAVRHEEFACSTGTFDPVAVRSKILDLTTRLGAGIIGVIDGAGIIEASVGLTVARFWDTMDRHLEATWNFVHPNFRRSSHTKELSIFANDIADHMKLPLISLHNETPTVDYLTETMSKRSLRRVAIIFRHEPRCA